MSLRHADWIVEVVPTPAFRGDDEPGQRFASRHLHTKRPMT
jgi:hypothetical protein